MDLSALLTYPRLFADLSRFLGVGLSKRQCRDIIRERLQTREERFLQHAERYIYGYPGSPYLHLLRHVGCEYGDLVSMVRRDGLERTLGMLRDEGAYVSFEEFKGLQPAMRGSQIFHFAERDFDNPFRRNELRVTTGASRSRGSPITVALDSIAENRAIAFSLMLEAVGAERSPLVTWLPGFPAGSGFFVWLGLSHIGRPPVRWFSVTDPERRFVPRRTRMLLPVARLLARRRGLMLPMPEFTPLSASERVLDALLDLRHQHGECSLITTPSSGVRVASLARQSELSLEGIRILVGSEPLTPGKAAEIQRAGATVSSRYIFTEGGAAGIGCGAPQAPDDMHFMADSFALIRHHRTTPGLGEIQTYMFTSLLKFAPKIMLNVESDDFGEFSSRRCGCPLDDLGLDHHLASVRSFTKLTSEGATIVGARCIQLLEEELPREFGGSSIDYQLLEAEDENHMTRLYLVVSPEVGEIDEDRLLRYFTRGLWDRHLGISDTLIQANTFRVIRRRPVETLTGKLLPFHTQASSVLANGPAPVREGHVSGGRRAE